MDALFDEFKRLEKLCNEIYGEQHGVTLYINEMERTPNYAARKVFGWDYDLQGLKRVRHIRNAMSHDDSDGDTDYTFEDVEFIKNFHARIMKGEDPLALLRKQSETVRAKNKAISETVSPDKLKVNFTDFSPRRVDEEKEGSSKVVWFVLVAAFALIAVVVIAGFLLL
jgi:hypothetical protein